MAGEKGYRIKKGDRCKLLSYKKRLSCTDPVLYTGRDPDRYSDGDSAGPDAGWKLMGMYGAAGFRFILDRRMVYLIIPFISLIVAILGVRTATREAVTIKITPEL